MGCNGSKDESNNKKKRALVIPPPTTTMTKEEVVHEVRALHTKEELATLENIFIKQFGTNKQFIVHFSSYAMRMKKKAAEARQRVSDREISGNKGEDDDGANNNKNKNNNAPPKLLKAADLKTFEKMSTPVQIKSREDDILQGMVLIDQRMTNLGLKQVKMKDDGNCQFRSLAHQLFGNAELHQQVRDRTVQFLGDHQEEYSFYFDGMDEWDRYTTVMKMAGTWGDEFTIKAACEAYRIVIHVLTSTQEHYHVEYLPDGVEKDNTAGLLQVFLAYISPIHYNSITLDKNKKQPSQKS